MQVEDVLKNGIVGAGGAGFPTHIKLMSSPEVVILNAAECEPLLHKDEELLNHCMAQVIDGFRTVIDLTGARRGIIGIKKKHRSLIDRLSALVAPNMEVFPIGDFYPAGDEVTLVYLTTGRVIQPGALPISVGCVVQNVETVLNIALNRPVVDKYLTVAGAVQNPATLRVPLGTSFSDILGHFEIATRQFGLRSGGLMMGKVERDLGEVVTKRTGGLLVLPSDHACMTSYERYGDSSNTVRTAKASCDQCSFCTELCPRYLLGYPVRPETAMRNTMFSGDGFDRVHAGNAFCCECNLCTLYACPESLDPRGATILEKKGAAERGLRWEGLPVRPHPMADYRKVPTKKLMQRLDVTRFEDSAPLSDLIIEPAQVRIPLQQHVGAPAVPVVAAGQKVKRYDLIAAAGGKISSNIHASIDGTVVDITGEDIIIKR